MSHEANIYPHHDLLNLAFHQLEIIQNKKKSGISDGINLDCLACLISLGISMEALINFCGVKVSPDWNERWAYKKKLGKCCIALGICFDETQEPLCALKALKELRDNFAHAKPIRKKGKAKSVEQMSELMATSWDHELEYDNVLRYYNAVKDFENYVYSNEKVKTSGILTSGIGWFEEGSKDIP